MEAMSDEDLTDAELRACVSALENVDPPMAWPPVVRDGHEARLVRAVASLAAIRSAALALSRAVEPADLPPAARPALLTLRALLAAAGLDPLGDDAAVPPT